MHTRLICYTLNGTLPTYGDHLTRNPDHVARIYVCGESLRDMTNLIKQHLPAEEITPPYVANPREKGWPSQMRNIKRERGVWVAKAAGSIVIHKADKGTLTEIE